MRNVLALVLLFQSFIVFSQCMLFEVPLEKRIDKSSVIVEGRVISSTTYKNELNLINTLHEVEIYKVFKGTAVPTIVIIETDGGAMNNEMQTVSSALELWKDEKGIFFLNPHHTQSGIYRPYSGPQGLIYFNEDGSAGEPFKHYENIEVVYGKLAQRTGNFPKILRKPEPAIHNDDKAAAPNITDITPKTITAGTKSVLTIKGSGFGSIRGSGTVIFKNASTSPSIISPLNSQYISWKDNEIKVEVPSKAGTSNITVSKNGSDVSTDELKIDYAQLNATNGSGNSEFQAPHINDNGAGGYTWRMNDDFHNNTAARESFIRAMKSWRDVTCVNWEVGEPTGLDQTSEDDRNIVRFGAVGEMDDGVLASARSYYKGCNSTTYYVDELDVTYTPDINWNYGSGNPGFSEYDMESVTVHELGHAHQQGHVIDLDDVMHNSIGNGVLKRELSYNNRRGGKFVQAQSVTTNDCGPSPMSNFPGCDPSVGLPNVPTENIKFRIYPNPATDFVQITFIERDSEFVHLDVIDFSGRAIISKEIYQQHIRISTSELPGGIYLIQVADDQNHVHSTKFVVTKGQ